MIPDDIADKAGRYGGLIHGDDAEGCIDIEFRSVLNAVRFGEALTAKWIVDFRDPVTCMWGGATVTVKPEGQS